MEPDDSKTAIKSLLLDKYLSLTMCPYSMSFSSSHDCFLVKTHSNTLIKIKRKFLNLLSYIGIKFGLNGGMSLR